MAFYIYIYFYDDITFIFVILCLLLLLQLPQLLLLCGEVPADDCRVAISRDHVRADLSDD